MVEGVRIWDALLVSDLKSVIVIEERLKREDLANLPDEATEAMTVVAKTGVYYGYAQVIPPAERMGEFEKGELAVLPMVMSLGWNPFYDNKKMTAVSQRSICVASSLYNDKM